ncbi:hypothetical protein TSUD_318200 [Trifolium subterraneum]|uniref:Uncharacterized protein n=1 Tax=Trifolium subterraneum TaxID=3900 RepID=A0A2Z6NJC8_TRISU|nr:hypothetical protein TSUD_318200 [Trifolium subterraneum]
MIPLGRGFFEFRFSCADDLRSVWSSGAWNLNPGLLRLSCWSLDFNPFNQKQTHSQVWVRLHYLPLEYWQPRILFEIAGAIGTPISIDENTRNHSFGHYTRVLVDVNMAGNLPDSLSKEVVANVLVRDVLNIEEELSPGISFGADPLHLEHVEEVHTVDLSDTPRVENPPSWCGMSSSNVISSNEVLNPNVAHDLAILKQYWEGKDARDIGYKVYTDEEKREATINFLRNHVAADDNFSK